MKNLSDEDWELISACHDGELTPELHKTCAQRLENEPELREALASIKKVSGSLKALKPKLANKAPKTGRVWRPWLIPGVAASLAGLAFVYAAFAPDLGEPQTPLGWHQVFLEKEYSPLQGVGVRNTGFFGSSGVPDLEPAGLSLVEQRSGEANGFVAHYVGRNLCRLTVMVTSVPEPFVVPEGALSATWVVEARLYTVIATRMDETRFDAIATYIRQISERSRQPDIVVAMQSATSKAAPCA
ncbi:MAG TPA: hypothetical protein ENJ90_09225 [Devosia sp.]|nr:hypothetical protein [Devosia sp.]